MEETIVFKKISCFTCGCLFGVNAEHHGDLVRSRHSFTCPNGHQQSFVESDEVKKLRADCERYKERCNRLSVSLNNETNCLKSEQNTSRALRGVITKLKNQGKK